MRHTCTTGVTPNTQPQQILVSKAASWRSSAERRTASERTHANILGWSLRIYCCLNVPQETPVSAHLEQYFHPWPWEWSDTLLCSRKKSSLCPALECRGSGDPRKLKCISTGDLGRCPAAQCRTTSRAEQRPDPHRGQTLCEIQSQTQRISSGAPWPQPRVSSEWTKIWESLHNG